MHANRVLQQLRDQNLLYFNQRAVGIPDLGRLEEFAEFDPDYLHLRLREPTQMA